MNNEDVREDMHVHEESGKWDLCNISIYENFKRGEGSLHVYEHLLRE